MDDALSSLVESSLYLSFANQALARGQTALASSQSFARTEELANAAFSSALYGLLALMQARPAMQTKTTDSKTTDVSHVTYTQPLAVS